MRTLTMSTSILSLFLLLSGPTSAFAKGDAKETTYIIKHKTKQMGQALPDKALVYILRPAFVGLAIKMWAFVDDRFIGVTKGKNYTYALVTPGEHVFWSKAENVNAVKLNVEGGKTYYLQQKIQPGGLKARVKFLLIEEAKTPKMFKKMQVFNPHGTSQRQGADLYREVLRTGARTCREAFRVITLTPYSSSYCAEVTDGSR